MRSYQHHPGPCEVCGRHVACGAYWINRYIVLDFGVPTMAPIEPNMTTPRRCDDCDILARLQDPEYRRLCWPEAEKMEAEARRNGGVVKPALPA